MQSPHGAIEKASAPVALPELDVVGFVCLLGVVISLALIPHIDAGTLGFVLAHLE